jgi:hypothetical protein
MSNLSQFTNTQNLKLLWDVLLDEIHINPSNKPLIANIKTIFESNINLFTLRANSNLHIMELNKQFLSQVVLAVNRLFPNLKKEQNIQKITIFPEIEDNSEPYKIADIQSLRQSEFEKELEIKKMELDTYMTPPKPKELDFSKSILDGKIKSMDSLIADKLEQRNLEIEYLQNSNYNTTIDSEKWLTPKETSVKNENTNFFKKSINNNNTKNNIYDELEQNKIKKVSFEKEDSTMNIFSKLKKQPSTSTSTSNSLETINLNNSNSYDEQQSLPLPLPLPLPLAEEKHINKKGENKAILPKTEMINQLNDMNTKIDKLYEIVVKLTNLIQNNQKEGIQDNQKEGIQL